MITEVLPKNYQGLTSFTGKEGASPVPGLQDHAVLHPEGGRDLARAAHGPRQGDARLRETALRRHYLRL